MKKDYLITIVMPLIIFGIIFLLTGCETVNQNNISEENFETDLEPTPEETIIDDDIIIGEGAIFEEGAIIPEGREVIREFNISGENFSFSKNEITVNKGDIVRILFASTGGTHAWVIDEFNASTKVINSGESDMVEFKADNAGIFEYYCSVANHRQLGMVGKLIVEE
ncbi:MAG: plastocyanin/azurin family copper-binding protein [Patescibacteria group bacterium]